MVTRIYLVRHAEAEGNVNETFQGRTDTDVTEKGYAQLACLAERFRDIPITALYVSPMRRTRATAEAVNKYHGLPMQERCALMEIDGGAWEGKSWAEIPVLFPAEYDAWQTRMHLFAAPDGERMTEVYARMQDAVDAIAAAHPGETVAVVSHGCAIRNYLAYAGGTGITSLPQVGWSDNTSVSLVEYDETGRTRIVFKNDAAHLNDALSTLAHSQWCKYEEKQYVTDADYRAVQTDTERMVNA